MSYQEKLDSLRALLEEHNKAFEGQTFDEWADPRIKVDKLIVEIQAIGGTNEARLSRMRHEDIEACFKASNNVVAAVLIKEIADLFRDKNRDEEKEAGDSNPVYVGPKKAARMSPDELVAAFNPEDPDTPVGKKLVQKSKGQPFLVYQSGRIVDVPNSVALLKECMQGFKGRDRIDVGNNDWKPVYRVGELPDAYADENPLFPGRPLRPDGTCDQLNRSWEGVPKEVRQFIYVAIQDEAIDLANGGLDKAHDILSIALQSDALAKLRGRYSEIAVKMSDLAQTGNLPALTIPLVRSHEQSCRDKIWNKGMIKHGIGKGEKVQWGLPEGDRVNRPPFYVAR